MAKAKTKNSTVDQEEDVDDLDNFEKNDGPNEGAIKDLLLELLIKSPYTSAGTIAHAMNMIHSVHGMDALLWAKDYISSVNPHMKGPCGASVITIRKRRER